MKILFVEDTDVFINRFKPMLENLGEVCHYKSSNAARRAMGYDNSDFDLVVCDHNILRFEDDERRPATGDEVYYHLRHWCGEKTPFLHFSAAPCPEEYDVRMYNGNKDPNFHVLGKNYDSPLLEVIQEIMEKK